MGHNDKPCKKCNRGSRDHTFVAMKDGKFVLACNARLGTLGQIDPNWEFLGHLVDEEKEAKRLRKEHPEEIARLRREHDAAVAALEAGHLASLTLRQQEYTALEGLLASEKAAVRAAQDQASAARAEASRFEALLNTANQERQREVAALEEHIRKLDDELAQERAAKTEAEAGKAEVERRMGLIKTQLEELQPQLAQAAKEVRAYKARFAREASGVVPLSDDELKVVQEGSAPTAEGAGPPAPHAVEADPPVASSPDVPPPTDPVDEGSGKDDQGVAVAVVHHYGGNDDPQPENGAPAPDAAQDAKPLSRWICGQKCPSEEGGEDHVAKFETVDPPGKNLGLWVCTPCLGDDEVMTEALANERDALKDPPADLAAFRAAFKPENESTKEHANA